MEQAIKEVAFVTTSLSFDRGMLSRLKDESKKRDLTVSQYVRSVLGVWGAAERKKHLCVCH